MDNQTEDKTNIKVEHKEDKEEDKADDITKNENVKVLSKRVVRQKTPEELFYTAFVNAITMLMDRGYKYTGWGMPNPQLVELSKVRELTIIQLYNMLPYSKTRENYRLYCYMTNPNYSVDHIMMLHFSETLQVVDLNAFSASINPVTKVSNRMPMKVVFIGKGKSTKLIDQKYKKIPNVTIEYFLEDFFIINHTNHILVPKHKALTAEEKEAYIAKLGLGTNPKKLFAKLFSTGAISRWYGYKPGDIINVNQWCPILGTFPIHRLVI
jgi:DNA-directed RNA polymerase subunit H (RpoH/RPB5)